MKGKTELGVLLTMAGTACPLCSTRTIRGALFCSHCGSSGRLRIDPARIEKRRKEVFIPHQLVR